MLLRYGGLPVGTHAVQILLVLLAMQIIDDD